MAEQNKKIFRNVMLTDRKHIDDAVKNIKDGEKIKVINPFSRTRDGKEESFEEFYRKGDKIIRTDSYGMLNIRDMKTGDRKSINEDGSVMELDYFDRFRNSYQIRENEQKFSELKKELEGTTFYDQNGKQKKEPY